MSRFLPTERTTLKRLPKRASYDTEIVYAILDEAFICHVGLAVDGRPVVSPTSYARVEDRLYIHGSQASRMLRSMRGGIEVCVSVTLIDGLVLARSAYHHSINYRSVVIFGQASAIEDPCEKLHALRAISEHIVPGRWAEVRPPNENELRATMVLMLPLVEISAKVRTGPPVDDEEDYASATWAGEVPLQLIAATPVPDPRLPPEIEPPPYARDYRRRRAS